MSVAIQKGVFSVQNSNLDSSNKYYDVYLSIKLEPERILHSGSLITSKIVINNSVKNSICIFYLFPIHIGKDV